MLTRRSALMGAAVAAVLAAAPAFAESAAPALNLPRQKVELVAPPFVHPHEQATKQGPQIVEFRMELVEKQVMIDEQGTKFQAMTFNGSMPGPMMVVHQGGYVELTLVNPETNTMPHNIDFHSATGALGGGALTLINPGEQVVLRWKADRAGVFVYHCAPEGSMIPWHVVSGMHGSVMVLPRDGLKDGNGKPLRYDRIYYIGEHDLYVPRDENGKYKTYESVAESYADTMDVMRKLIPTHVVFNGKVGALTGKNAMTAKVGETVMIVHSQANRDSRDRPALVELAPGTARYRAAGDFTRDGKPADAPPATIGITQRLTIMKHQVTGAEYQRCVVDGACRSLPADVVSAADRPAVQVSWRDADAYAAWLSGKTGETYRLPTDAEWAYAAGSRWQDDSLPLDGGDPSRRWLARYELEASRKSVARDSEPRPIGAFGANENGLLDAAGNVWEWTSSCFVRTALDAAGRAAGKPTVNCGVRAVEGQHRAYVTDFIRDARAGGCAAGVPPSNLGFRLVRQPHALMSGVTDVIFRGVF